MTENLFENHSYNSSIVLRTKNKSIDSLTAADETSIDLLEIDTNIKSRFLKHLPSSNLQPTSWKCTCCHGGLPRIKCHVT